jgi:hypothetical protein
MNGNSRVTESKAEINENNKILLTTEQKNVYAFDAYYIEKLNEIVE